jgi:hypothetical protein
MELQTKCFLNIAIDRMADFFIVHLNLSCNKNNYINSLAVCNTKKMVREIMLFPILRFFFHHLLQLRCISHSKSAVAVVEHAIYYFCPLVYVLDGRKEFP